jgi:hypothetical protein
MAILAKRYTPTENGIRSWYVIWQLFFVFIAPNRQAQYRVLIALPPLALNCVALSIDISLATVKAFCWLPVLDCFGCHMAPHTNKYLGDGGVRSGGPTIFGLLDAAKFTAD